MNDLPTTLAVLEHYGLISGSVLTEATIRIYCPIHGESRPSFDVDLANGRCRCWGCGFGGDIADVVAALEHKDKLHAWLKVAQIKKGLDPEFLKIRLEFTDVRRDPEKELQASKDFFLSLDKQDWDSVTSHYLLDRGFSKRVLRKMDVRINPSSEHPIAIPIYQDGVFKGYVLRATDDREDKYKFSKGFEKTKCVFGKTLSQDAPVVCGLVVEGALDKAAADQVLIESPQDRIGVTVQSIQGWHISEAQLSLLDGPLICGLDNDKKGWEGYERLRKLHKYPVVRLLYPSWAKDPADMGGYELRASLRHAKKLLGVTSG